MLEVYISLFLFNIGSYFNNNCISYLHNKKELLMHSPFSRVYLLRFKLFNYLKPRSFFFLSFMPHIFLKSSFF